MNLPKSVYTDRLIEILKDYDMTSILEMGCGIGHNIWNIHCELGVPVSGCDRLSKGGTVMFPYKQLDLKDPTDYADREFDMVLFGATLYMMDDVETVMEEAKRIARRYVVIADFQSETEPLPYRNYKTYFSDWKVDEYPFRGWPTKDGTTILVCTRI
jgi:hypothetical protein